MSLTNKQIAFIKLANANGFTSTISRKDAKALCKANDFKWPRSNLDRFFSNPR